MKKKLLFWVLVLAVAAGAYSMPRMVQSSIPTVYYVTPNRTTYESVVNCQGTVLSGHVQDIYVQTPVVVRELCVDIGDEVEAGQVLFYIDRDKTQELSAAVGLLHDVSAGVLPGRFTQENDVNWAALASLYGLSAIAGSGLDYGSVLSGVLGETGILPGQQQANATTVSDVAPGFVTAPIGGVVTSIAVTEDVPAYSGQPLMSISDNEQYKVLAAVNEGDIARIHVGDRATVRGVGFAGVHYTGEITKIYPTARKALNGTTTETVVDVEITLEHADAALKPGFTAKVEIVGGNPYELITVPYESIKQDANNDEFVYVYADGRIQKRVVTTGREMTSEVEILDGISADSIVLYNPGENVQEGAMIQLKGRAHAD